MQQHKDNNSNESNSSKSEIDRVGDLISEMVDRELAKGDDEYYEMARSYRKKDDSSKSASKPKRKRGRGI